MYLCFAPMDWITNCATRLIYQQVFQKYKKNEDVFDMRTEFMNVDWFLINPHQVIKHILTSEWQRPIIQIYWWNFKTLIQATEIIQQEYKDLFCWIELNTWCPSNTVMKVWWWSDMLKNKIKTLEIIKNLSNIPWSLPFSLKTRAWLNDSDKEEQKNFIIEASHYCSKISIHWRTLKQLYLWDADRNFIQNVKREINEKWNTECKIIGNGWIVSYFDAEKKMEQFNIDGIMIWQAAIWNPWIFTPHEPTFEERLDIILKHLDYYVACDQRFEENILSNNNHITVDLLMVTEKWLQKRIEKNLKWWDFQPHTIVEFRKYLFQYVKWIPWSKEWKQSILSCKWYHELRDSIIEFFNLKKADI